MLLKVGGGKEGTQQVILYLSKLLIQVTAAEEGKVCTVILYKNENNSQWSRTAKVQPAPINLTEYAITHSGAGCFTVPEYNNVVIF